MGPRSKAPIANEDRSIIATFNGEIHNFREPRQELREKGHQFAFEGDSEALVQLWEEDGPAAFGECTPSQSGIRIGAYSFCAGPGLPRSFCVFAGVTQALLSLSRSGAPDMSVRPPSFGPKADPSLPGTVICSPPAEGLVPNESARPMFSQDSFRNRVGLGKRRNCLSFQACGKGCQSLCRKR